MSRFASVGTHPMDGIAVENSAVGARSMSEAADVEEITGSADEDENVINEPMEEEEGVGEEQNPVSQEKQTSANEDDNMMQHDCQQIQGSISIANTLFGRTAYDATDSFVSSIMLHILENQSLDQDSYERIEKETSVVDDMEDHNDDDSMITDNDMQEVKYEEEDLYQIVAEEEQNQEAEIESIKLEKSSASSTPDLTRELTSSTLEGMESTPEYSLSYEDANDETTSYTWEASDEGNNSSTGDNFY
ncbi:hypothetical protein BX666DRAFT_1887589 [Dichotomocladium elegans]|nr:hypothetical protein BX666DRAFT_1887589 [Dichotomocladium elegans]